MKNLDLSSYYSDRRKADAAKANIIQMHQNQLAEAAKQKAAINHRMQRQAMILESKRMADQLLKNAKAKQMAPLQNANAALQRQLAEQKAATQRLIDAAKKAQKARSRQQTQESAAIRGAKTSQPAAHTDAKFLPNVPTFSMDSDLNKLKNAMLQYMKDTDSKKMHPAFNELNRLMGELNAEQRDLTGAAQYLGEASEADTLLAHRLSMAHADKVLQLIIAFNQISPRHRIMNFAHRQFTNSRKKRLTKL